MSNHNLLFLFTDEQRADTMAAYGNAKISTPNLDRLARESVVMEKCYVTQPVCTPSRSSILTGLYPHTNGCVRNNIPLREDTPCLPEMVRGYRSAYLGKWHLGDEIFAQHGFEHWISIEDMYIQHYRPHRDKNARSTYHHWLVDHGYKPQNANGAGPGVFPRSTTAQFAEADCKPAYLARETVAWLRQQKRDEPFIAFVNFLEPHMPFTGPRNSQYPPDYVDLPKNFAHVPDERNHLKNRLMRAHYRRQGSSSFRLDIEEGWRRLIANYWGLVSQVDAAVGTILDALEACGLAENTIVVYTSDHGDMMGSHGLLAKTVMFEESVTVPLLIKAPGLAPRKERQVVSQIDLVPTLLDLLGEPIPSGLQGQSVRGLLERGEPPKERDVFIEWSGSDSGLSKFEDLGAVPDAILHLGSAEDLAAALRDPVRTVVTQERWKLSFSPATGKHELYNLNEDPYEMNNVYGTPEHETVFRDLVNRIRAWGKRVGDDVASSL